MKTLATVTLVALAATASGAAAHTRVDARQAKQWDRIQNGRDNGTITWREGLKLRREQAQIARTEAQFKADGRLTHDEKRALNQLQNTANHNISRQASDGWYRAWWLPRFGR